jgi:hypothetical protein
MLVAWTVCVKRELGGVFFLWVGVCGRLDCAVRYIVVVLSIVKAMHKHRLL